MRVSEIFYSIQGEGINQGLPSIFLRLSGCNLHCWWCDAPYTWLFSKKLLENVKNHIKKLEVKIPPQIRMYDRKKEEKTMGISQIVQKIRQYSCKHIVITGGESLLQQMELTQLIKQLKQQGYFIEVETNGSVLPTPYLQQYIDQFNVSIKLESSGNEKEIREKQNVLRVFTLLSSAYFKFVVDTRKDLNEITRIVNNYNIEPSKVILMPQAYNQRLLEEKAQWLVEICKQFGYRFSNRLQIQIYGKKRAV